MLQVRGFFVTGLLSVGALLAAGPAAQAVPVASLYVVMVPAADTLQAAQAAMRVELVRLTGRREAASNPAFAALIDGARQYVQLERGTTSGQVQVLFDEAKLSAAIGAAGGTLWNADRPLLWVKLPPQDPAAAEAMRARLSAAAEERGLPITIATAGQPNDVQAGPAALDAARSAGAAAALVGQPLASTPGSFQWTLTAADASGQWVGGPELAIDNATDMLASAAQVLDRAPVTQVDCHIVGVKDLASLVNVLAAVHAATGVSQVAVSGVDGDQLTLQLQARGSSAQLQRALADERLQPVGTSPDGVLEYRYVAGP